MGKEANGIVLQVLVTLARVAERAERYDEMADFMKQRVQVGSALNPEEHPVDLLPLSFHILSPFAYYL